MSDGNKRISDFDRLADDLLGKHSKKANSILLTQSEELGEEDIFMNNYFKLLEYVQPKLQRVENTGEKEDNTIVIQHVTMTPEEAREAE